MKIRKFTDTVEGVRRIIIIVDEPSTEIESKLDEVCGSFMAPLPNTTPTEAPEEKTDEIWGDDNTAAILADMVKKTAQGIVIPADAQPTWFQQEIMAEKDPANMLMKIDALYSLAADKPAFKTAAGYILKKISESKSVYTNPAKSLKCMPHMTRPIRKKIKEKWKTATFLDGFEKRDLQTQQEDLSSLFQSLLKKMAK